MRIKAADHESADVPERDGAMVLGVPHRRVRVDFNVSFLG
jgi:hypothetical protein